MQIYSVYLNNKKHIQYKKYNDAIDFVSTIISTNSYKFIKIIVENFSEYAHSDTSCKFDLLFEFSNGNIIKNIIY